MWAISHTQRFAAAIASTPPTDPNAYWLSSRKQRAMQEAAYGMDGPDGAVPRRSVSESSLSSP